MPQADSSFMRRLKELDPKLGCEFDRDTERFFITYSRAVGPPVPVLVVKNAINGGFRHPDNREIISLQKGDLTRESLDSRLTKTAHYMENVRAKTRKDRRSNIRDMTKDAKLQLMRATNPSSKANRPFRQIAPKVTGKIF